MKRSLGSVLTALLLVLSAGCHSASSKSGGCTCAHEGASACTCAHCKGSSAICNCPK